MPNNFTSVSKASSSGMCVIFKDNYVRVLGKDNETLVLFIYEVKEGNIDNKCNSVCESGCTGNEIT